MRKLKAHQSMSQAFKNLTMSFAVLNNHIVNIAKSCTSSIIIDTNPTQTANIM